MLLYLCSNQNVDLFNFLEEKDYEIPIKKLSGTFNLKQFVIRDVRNLKQFHYFVIDLKALKNSEDEIIEAVIAFEAMYRSRVIIFAEGFEGGNPLISRLIDNKIYNIITSSDYDEIKEEMIQCVSPDGKDLRSAIKGAFITNNENIEQKKTGYSFICQDVKIAVVGAVHKVGTTTTAMNLVNYLVNIGAEAAYVEANSNEHLKCLPSFYKDISEKDTHLEYKGVKYYFKGNFPSDNNFIVIDFGTIAQCGNHILKQCETLILCGTAKPYEIVSIKTALKELYELPINMIFSYTPETAQKDVRKFFEKDCKSISFSSYSPDLFDWKVNSLIFHELIKEYEL